MRFDALGSHPSVLSEKHVTTQRVWNLGDGTQQAQGMTEYEAWKNEMRTRHLYASPGIYDVTLRLTDNLGFTSTVVQDVTVGTPSEEPLDEEREDGSSVITRFWGGHR